MANSSKAHSCRNADDAAAGVPQHVGHRPGYRHGSFPGAGHLIQKRWIRGLLLMASITTMFVLGLLMQGRVYHPNGGDILDILGFVGDVGAGGLYIVTRVQGLGPRRDCPRHRRLRHQVPDRRRTAELHQRRRRLSHRHRKEAVIGKTE